MKRKDPQFGKPMTLDVYNTQGAVVSQQVLPAEIFSVPITEELVHFVVTAQQANSRKGTSSTKTRGEVRGGGKKPWKQKGTGRARHGSTRSPIWRGGGITFGPTTDRNWSIKVNKKVKIKALRMVLSDKAARGSLVLIDTLQLPSAKTKEAHALLKRLPFYTAGSKQKKATKVGMVVAPAQNTLRRSFRNLDRVSLLSPASLNILDMLKADTLVIPLNSLEQVINHFKKQGNTES